MTQESSLEPLDRVSLMLGPDFLDRIGRSRIIIFGVGGVGSWCAESLIRTGVKNLTLVDSDRVCITNINRQLQATTQTIDQVKTDAMKARLQAINPTAAITGIQRHYDEETADSFDLNQYDFVIDAIDSLKCKMRLLHNASQSTATVLSAFGAACKIDPSRITVDEFLNVKGCRLGSKLRKLMRRANMLPKKEIQVVYSDEILPDACIANRTPPTDATTENDSDSTQFSITHGSVAHITGIVGLTLASLVVRTLQSSGPAKIVSPEQTAC
jgi:tRNA A37 threonylcarbamoyladenosine dehydratase